MKRLTLWAKRYAEQEIEIVLTDEEWQIYNDRIENGDSINDVFPDLEPDEMEYGNIITGEIEWISDYQVLSCQCQKKNIEEKFVD